MVRDRRTTYSVADGGDVVGVVTLDAVKRTDPDDHGETSVRSILDHELPRIPAELGAFEGYVALSQDRSGVALVESGVTSSSEQR